MLLSMDNIRARPLLLCPGPHSPHQNPRVPESPTFNPAYLHQYLSRVIDERTILLALSSWVRWCLHCWLYTHWILCSHRVQSTVQSTRWVAWSR